MPQDPGKQEKAAGLGREVESGVGNGRPISSLGKVIMMQPTEEPHPRGAFISEGLS